MSAARTLAALAAAGGDLRVDGRQLVLVGPRTLPLVLRAEVRAAAPALLRVASGRWRLDLAAWPAWRREAFEERAALMADGGVAPELVEQLAYLDTAEQPEPTPDPEPPEENLEVSSDDPARAPPPPVDHQVERRQVAGPAGAALGHLDAVELDGLLVLGPIRGRAALAAPSAAVDPVRAAAWRQAYRRRLDAGLDPESAARLTTTTHGPRPEAA